MAVPARAFAGDIANFLMSLHIASVTDAMVHRPSTVSSGQIDDVHRLRVAWPAGCRPHCWWRPRRAHRPPGRLWWVLWPAKALGSAALPVVFDGFYLDSAPDDAGLTTVGAHADAVANAVGSAFGVLAAVAAVLVVRAVTAQQRARAAVVPPRLAAGA